MKKSNSWPIVRHLAISILIAPVSVGWAKPPAGQEPAQPAPPASTKAPGGVPAGQAPALAKPVNATPTPTVQLKPGEVPKIEFDTPVFDFGKAKSGKDIEHDFWFHNNGSGPLELTAVKPSCGCTTASQYDRIVQPGQSGRIPIKVASGHMTGPITKTITVTTNVPGADATVSLQVKGELWQVIQATPNTAAFGNVSAMQTKEGPIVRKLTIANNTDAPAKLGDLTSSSPAYKGDLKELEPGKRWELTVTLADKLPTGAQNGSIDLSTGVSDLPKLQIMCNAYLIADVDVVPNRLVLPAARSANAQREFYVRNNGSKPLRLSDLTASNPLLKVGMQETQSGVAFKITVDSPPEYKAPKDGDKVTFKTDHPNFPVVTIPVSEMAAQPPFANAQAVAAPAAMPVDQLRAIGAKPTAKQ